ncbi:MAG: tRNA (adenosine(37)-N6)-threonylcarbamoyltransferase complex ATPase subunit type 1 TsaE [Bdellovibrionota bacterium]
MRSKTSKARQKRPSAKAVPGFSERTLGEEELRAAAAELARELAPGDRVLLEGVMGAGKTTFARALLSALGVHQPPEGSPTFAIAHEYEAPRGDVVHIDYYRLKSEAEIEDAGIPGYYWERQAIVISEWLAQFPEFERAVLKSGRCVQVSLVIEEGDSSRRRVRISRS